MLSTKSKLACSFKLFENACCSTSTYFRNEENEHYNASRCLKKSTDVLGSARFRLFGFSEKSFYQREHQAKVSLMTSIELSFMIFSYTRSEVLLVGHAVDQYYMIWFWIAIIGRSEREKGGK